MQFFQPQLSRGPRGRPHFTVWKPQIHSGNTTNQSTRACIIPHLTRGTMSSGSRGLSAAGPPSVWIWICLPDTQSRSVQQKSHRARRIVSLLWGCNWSSLYAAISFNLYLAGPAKSALLRCHFITHSLAVCAHVAPGSWSTAVSLLHQQRSSFSTRTEIQGSKRNMESLKSNKKISQESAMCDRALLHRNTLRTLLLNVSHCF